jgi:hypothetical protein
MCVKKGGARGCEYEATFALGISYLAFRPCSGSESVSCL